MAGFTLHPTTRIVIWLLLFLTIQCLDGWLLGLAFVVLPLLGQAALKRGAKLAWRTRWLILSLLVVFAWGGAGEPLLASALAPTYEGLREALLHLGRLLLVLMAVAAFLETMPLPAILGGTHQLLAPLRRFGFDSDQVVIRLMLVLHYVETLPQPRDWRILLETPALAAGNCSEFAESSKFVELANPPLRFTDYLIMMTAVSVSTACYLR